MSKFEKLAYLAYFKVMLGDQDKAWSPHIVCKQCVEHLRQWTKKARNSLHFGIPMVCHESKNHFDDSNFCAATQKESTGRTGIPWFIQTSTQQLGQFHIAMKFLFQCLKACLNWNGLILKIKPPFCLLTVMKPLFQMLIFLFLRH